jgi:limonene-1,2-epoxide hydrolase
MGTAAELSKEVAMPRPDASSVVTTYVKAWTSGDFDTARSTLRDDVAFVGPLGTADGIDDCIRGLQGLKQIVEASEQRKVIADGDDVCLIYDLLTTSAGTIPTAGWFQVRDGKIATITAFFDARPLDPAR